METVN